MIEDDIVTKLLDFIADANSNKINLAYADIIVTGGKGLKNAENFKLVCELAARAGRRSGRLAARWCRPAGSRPSARWARPARRCGPSSTSPPAFPARSSTASACEGADVIVAINTDRERADLRFRALRHRRQRDAGAARADRGVPPRLARAAARSACELKEERHDRGNNSMPSSSAPARRATPPPTRWPRPA